MRNILLGALIVFALVSTAGAADAKILVAVFSRADENYNVGYIEKGNTMILAEMIAEKTGADLFEIKPAKKYAADYQTCIDDAKKEQNRRARPAILEDKDISEYDIIFLGYPIWWGDLPMCVYTFIENHDWNGKIIIPFCTHEGSGISGTERRIANAAKGSDVRKGLAMQGRTAQNNRTRANESVTAWIKGLGLGF